MVNRTSFSLFCSHLDLAHEYWRKLIEPGDCVIDATCGNGYDSLFLAQLVLSENRGQLIALDKQKMAIDAAYERLNSSLSAHILSRVRFHHQCHSTFPEDIAPDSVALIVYNLGYLPGAGNKELTTTKETTFLSLTAATRLIKPGGCISVTCYPGHPEGKLEENVVLEFSASLNPKQWNCCHHRWTNRHQSPSLLLLQKSI